MSYLHVIGITLGFRFDAWMPERMHFEWSLKSLLTFAKRRKDLVSSTDLAANTYKYVRD